MMKRLTALTLAITWMLRMAVGVRDAGIAAVLRLSLPWVAGLTFVTLPPASGQQVVEIDFTAGRTIVDDEWQRSMDPYRLLVDWVRAVFYVHDNEDPEVVMVFSLDSGERVGAIPTPEGEGPFEFPHGRHGMDLAQDGGLYISGYLSVIEYSPVGEPVDSWRPHSMTTSAVCDFGGEPAVPAQGGIVRRNPDGTNAFIGPGPSRGGESARALAIRIALGRIVCKEDRAYVVTTNDADSDSVTVYHLDGKTGTIDLPTVGFNGLMDCRRWVNRSGDTCRVGLHNLSPSFDDHGNLVLFSPDEEVHGLIINPDTGCHAFVDNTTKSFHQPVAVHGDSVLVFHNEYTQREVSGRTVTHFRDYTNKVSIHPLKRVSGEACPGMLPSVR